jgi:hypothetical protein
MILRPEILLHPNIPKPLHGINPRTVLGQEWWDIERQDAYHRSGYCCLACGVSKGAAKYHRWLEGHELYEYDYKNGILTFKEIVALCHSCHNYIHSGRMQMMVNSGKMTQKKMDDIKHHGNSIIKANNLNKPKSPEDCAEWGEWKMVIYGKEYRGKFSDYEEWLEYYSHQ